MVLNFEKLLGGFGLLWSNEFLHDTWSIYYYCYYYCFHKL